MGAISKLLRLGVVILIGGVIVPLLSSLGVGLGRGTVADGRDVREHRSRQFWFRQRWPTPAHHVRIRRLPLQRHELSRLDPGRPEPRSRPQGHHDLAAGEVHAEAQPGRARLRPRAQGRERTLLQDRDLPAREARCQFHGSAHDAGIVFGPDLSDGQWHTITCRKTANSISGTVGSAFAAKHVVVGSISNGVALSLGGKSSGTQDLYEGLMDEVRVTIG